MSKTYKIGEAAALLNLKTYVLRFWETEFPEIAPLRTEKGQRLYAEEHIALLERIRYLLHDRGLTIGGARKALEEEQARGITYSFGVPGAISRDAARPVKQPAELERFDLAEEDEDSDENFSPAPYIDYPLDAGGSTPSRPLVRRKGQCNLPGIEESAAVYDDASPEDTDSALASSDIQGMLPLFSMVRTDPAAAKTVSAGTNFIRATAPDARGNASQGARQNSSPDTSPSTGPSAGQEAGLASSPVSGLTGASQNTVPAAPQTEQAPALFPAQGIPADVLHDVIRELQAVAAMLQGPAAEARTTAPVQDTASGHVSGASYSFNTAYTPGSVHTPGTGHSPEPDPAYTPGTGHSAEPGSAYTPGTGHSPEPGPASTPGPAPDSGETTHTARPDAPAPFSEPR